MNKSTKAKRLAKLDLSFDAWKKYTNHGVLLRIATNKWKQFSLAKGFDAFFDSVARQTMVRNRQLKTYIVAEENWKIHLESRLFQAWKAFKEIQQEKNINREEILSSILLRRKEK